ncbi:MAG: FKBP-type peptidyl-prolyl cis-trans isomerase [Treponema sp.]|jgi:FKBP-type peptidyl-prolyl cis-trans isomerase|nr:FKBP-type peptidyl-prolyl cis-trans isomerase [Treponema sp.]
MKRTALIFCLLLPVFALYARGIQEDVNLAEEKAQTSYAFGLIIGSDFRNAGLELDYAAFADGLREWMEKGSGKYTQDEALSLVQAALEAASAKKAEENRLKELQFLAENGERPDVRGVPSGLQYEVLSEGSGAKPGENDVVRVHYEGSLTDGTVFDSSIERGEPAELPLDQVIPGWSEGLRLMSVGSKYRLYIPSELAYGPRGAGQIIPPYSTLIFTVELLEILGFEEEESGE